ncbi:hypothetical protein V6N12_059035 [Hibiscus sabdariffa]|uniref:Uncharacterized protein n=1 Tax=Hibiscus sabdariffa TaxID=183260 RepID=A0ABR2EVT9_9ROSI
MSNGRPPDVLLQSVLPPRLEQLANPVSMEEQQAGKRSRGEGDEVMDVGLDNVDGTAPIGVLAVGSDGMVCDESSTNLSGGRSPVKPSFHGMLTGNKLLNPSVSTIPELDVEFHEGDVKISSVDGIHAINFSDRIHDKDVNEHEIPVNDGIEQIEAPVHGGILEAAVDVGVVGHSEIAYTDLVIPAKVTMNPKSHVAVRVLERGTNLGSKVVPARRSDDGERMVAPNSSIRVAGGRSVDRKGGSTQKKQDSRPPSKVVLGDWLGHMERELDRPKDRGEEPVVIRDGS